MLKESQKQDQLKAEIGLHILRPLLPIDEKDKQAIQSCYQALKQLHDQNMKSDEKADTLNAILKPHGLKFTFLTDENAKDYIMNNPNVYQLAMVGAQFLSYPWPCDHSEFKGLKQLVDSIFKEVNEEKTDAKAGLQTIQHALGAGMMMLQFKRGEKLKENVKI